jgi:hypothetical protein
MIAKQLNNKSIMQSINRIICNNANTIIHQYLNELSIFMTHQYKSNKLIKSTDGMYDTQ